MTPRSDTAGVSTGLSPSPCDFSAATGAPSRSGTILTLRWRPCSGTLQPGGHGRDTVAGTLWSGRTQIADCWSRRSPVLARPRRGPQHPVRSQTLTRDTVCTPTPAGTAPTPF